MIKIFENSLLENSKKHNNETGNGKRQVYFIFRSKKKVKLIINRIIFNDFNKTVSLCLLINLRWVMHWT